MAKELPYFRFTASEWLNDDISLESYEHKGAFIDFCAYYWSQDCDVTLEKLKKKFSNATSLLKDLISIGVIKHENKHDKIKIDFLDNQYDLLSEKRKLRQSAGSKGGNAKAMLKQKGSYKDKDKDNNKDKDNTINLEFSVFWNLYNKKINSKDCEKKWNNLKDAEREKIIYTLPNFLNSISDKQFLPHPLTYLNQKRWNDEIGNTPNSNEPRKLVY